MNKFRELRLSAIFKQNGKPSIGQSENDDPTIHGIHGPSHWLHRKRAVMLERTLAHKLTHP